MLFRKDPRPTRSWGEFYRDAAGDDYADHHVGVHGEFLDAVASRGPRLLEAGCGSAVHAIELAGRGLAVTGLDRDADVLARAADNVRKAGASVRFTGGDLFALPFTDGSFDAAYSQGVFEHFDPPEIHRLVAEQLRVARTVVFSVPNFWYRRGEFGDERLWKRSQWKQVLEPFRILDCRDYHVVRRKRNFLIPRGIMTLAVVQRR